MKRRHICGNFRKNVVYFSNVSCRGYGILHFEFLLSGDGTQRHMRWSSSGEGWNRGGAARSIKVPLAKRCLCERGWHMSKEKIMEALENDELKKKLLEELEVEELEERVATRPWLCYMPIK